MTTSKKDMDRETIAGLWRAFAAEAANREFYSKCFLYIHTPFCVCKCKYCKYESDPCGDPALIAAHRDRLFEEIEYFSDAVRGMEFDGLYFGGGTPTAYPPDMLADILSMLRGAFLFNNTGMSTCEMHAGLTTREHIEAAAQHGIERISFGVQSLNSKALQLAGRIPSDAGRLETLLGYAGECGVKERNIDLIAALPGESVSSFMENLERIFQFSPESVVIYHLTHDNIRYTSDEIEMTDAVMRDWQRARDLFISASQRAGYSPMPGMEKNIDTLIVKNDNSTYCEENKYELFSTHPASVLGLGKYSFSNIFGKTFYKNTGYRSLDNARFISVYEGHEKDTFMEACNLIFLYIRSSIPMPLSVFESVFGLDAADFIERYFKKLLDPGHIEIVSGHLVNRLKFRNETQVWELRDIMMEIIMIEKNRERGA